MYLFRFCRPNLNIGRLKFVRMVQVECKDRFEVDHSFGARL